jgi:hypothetical protein
MKYTSVLALVVGGIIPLGANAANVPYINANGIATHNIMVIQHSAILNAFNHFDGLHNTTSFTGFAETAKPHIDNNNDNNVDSDIYGKMPTYGEYGDDGTVFLPGRGRSGGDEIATGAPLWLDWHHTQDSAKFDKYKSVDSRNDLISVGFANTPKQLSNGYSQFGGFGGFVSSEEDAGDVDLHETGGYIGLYNGYRLDNMHINMAANFGTMYTDIESLLGDQNLTNVYMGAATNISYDIVLENALVLQPGLYAGYTWVYSHGYESGTEHSVSFNDFNAFELSPSVRAITQVGDGWYAALSARYAFNFTSGGDADMHNPTVSELDMDDYGEYGISFEKNMDRFNFAAVLSYRNGGRTGWNGGVRMQYRF